MTTPPDTTPDPIFPDGVYNDTPVRDVINLYTPDHRDAILATEDALTDSYTANNDELDDMMSDIQDQITTSSEAALALLKAGYDETRANLVAVQDTLDGLDAWIEGELEDSPVVPPPPSDPPSDPPADDSGDEGEE